jgi:amino acid transporter
VFDSDASAGWVKVFASLVILAMALVNLVGADLVGKVQTLIVFVLLIVFAIFVVATFTEIDFDRLAPSTYPSVSSIVAAVALTFFAYLGFAVIANTAESLPQPSRNVPRATFIALAIAGGLYVLISLGVYGTLSVEDVIASGDTALAEAAKPALGDAGFAMMAIAALLATASSVNANLFAAGGITANLAETRQFPSFFGGEFGSLGGRGSVISVAVVLVLANFFDISTIASVGSAIALVIFGLVGVAAVKLRHEIGANPVIVGTGVLGALVVLVLFCVDTARNEPRTFVSMIVVGVLAVAFDFTWRRRRALEPPPVAAPSTTTSASETST